MLIAPPLAAPLKLCSNFLAGLKTSKVKLSEPNVILNPEGNAGTGSGKLTASVLD